MKTEAGTPPIDHADPACPAARILVVDDRSNAEPMTTVLTGAGYTHVFGCSDLDVFIDRIDNTSVDLVLFDLSTPHDEVRLIREVRDRFPTSVELPIIVISSDPTIEAKHRRLLAGASDVFSGTLDPTELLCRVADLLEAHDLYGRSLSRQLDLESLVEEQTMKLQERLYDLGRLDQERRRLLSHLVHAEEEERRTIASDIHDDPIQKMVAASMRLDMVLEDHPDLGVDEQFQKARETVNRSIESLRNLMFELRPYVLDHDGLAAALAVFVAEEGKLPGSATYQVQSNLDSEPPESVRVILYRIAQEALVNVRKHAHATLVEITLEEGFQGYTLRVKDDGVGFDPLGIADPSLGHIGLTSMRERASLAGGWFRIESTDGAGATVEARIPRADDDEMA